MPIRRIARVTPTIIIGIFGSSGQSVERQTIMSVDIQTISFRQLKTAKKHSILICWKLSMPFLSSPYNFTLISLLNSWKILPWNVKKKFLLTTSTAILARLAVVSECRLRFWGGKLEHCFQIYVIIILKNRTILTKSWIFKHTAEVLLQLTHIQTAVEETVLGICVSV